jgi:protein SCO1
MLSFSRVLRYYTLAILLLVSASGGLQAEPLFEPPATVARELEIGDLLPDVPLRGGDGREMRLRDFRGKALAVTFFYSRCTRGEFCPLVGRNFDVAQTLLTRMGVGGRCHLLSISLDPKHDTPDVLTAYARGYQADPQLWTFASGNEADVQKLGNAVGLEYRRVDDRIDHNLRTVVVDASGHIRHIFRGDGWTPQELAAELSATARQYH